MSATMSTAVRRLVSLAVVAIVVAVGAWVYVSQGDGPDQRVLPTPAPGPPPVKVDTPELRVLKAKVGVQDCPATSARATAAGDLTLPCLGGGDPVDLSNLSGPMLISFWQAGCGPCRQEMPALEAFARAHATTVPVLGVDFLDQFPGSALQLMKRTGATYPSVADPLGDLQQDPTFAKVTHLPVLFFIDASGKVAYQKIGGVTSESEVTALVKQHLGVDL